MSRQKKWKGGREKRDGSGYVALPFVVLESAAFLGLNPHAKALLLDLAAQYRGNNNGDLSAPWRAMKARGWKSEDTLHKAKQALLESGLIAETRKGARPNKATLYGLTWFALDECGGKLDIKPSGFPRGAYRRGELQPFPTAKNRTLTTEVGVGERG